MCLFKKLLKVKDNIYLFFLMQEKLVGNTINIKNSFCHLLYGNQIDHICEKKSFIHGSIPSQFQHYLIGPTNLHNLCLSLKIILNKKKEMILLNL